MYTMKKSTWFCFLVSLTAIVTDARVKQTAGSTNQRGRKPQALALQSNAGGGGFLSNVIPYAIDASQFSPTDIDMIKAAMADWSRYSCIKFLPSRSASNLMVFKQGSKCQAIQGVSQTEKIVVEVAKNCMNKDTILQVLQNAIRLNTGNQAATVNPAGIQDKLTFDDVKAVNLMYNCEWAQEIDDSWCFLSNFLCPNGGFVGPQCECWCRGNPVRLCWPYPGSTNPDGTKTDVKKAKKDKKKVDNDIFDIFKEGANIKNKPGGGKSKTGGPDDDIFDVFDKKDKKFDPDELKSGNDKGGGGPDDDIFAVFKEVKKRRKGGK